MIVCVKEGGFQCLDGGSPGGVPALLVISQPFLGKGANAPKRLWLLHCYFGHLSFVVLKTIFPLYCVQNLSTF